MIKLSTNQDTLFIILSVPLPEYLNVTRVIFHGCLNTLKFALQVITDSKNNWQIKERPHNKNSEWKNSYITYSSWKKKKKTILEIQLLSFKLIKLKICLSQWSCHYFFFLLCIIASTEINSNDNRKLHLLWNASWYCVENTTTSINAHLWSITQYSLSIAFNSSLLLYWLLEKFDIFL